MDVQSCPYTNKQINKSTKPHTQRFLDDIDIGLNTPEAAAPVKRQLAQHMAEEHLSVMRASQVGLVVGNMY